MTQLSSAFESLPSDSERLAEIERIRTSYQCDEAGLVPFSPVVEGEYNLLGQYAAAFVDGFEGKPKIAEDLFTGDPSNWYTLRIKPEDVLVFGRRLQDYKEEQRATLLARLADRTR